MPAVAVSSASRPDAVADGLPDGTSQTERGLTLAEQAYRSLRRDIVCGELRPDAPLRLETLRKRYGSSFSPIREALSRLQSEKLVVSQALRGFRVAPLSAAEMWDAVEVRILVDGDALKRSIAHGGDEWESRVVASFHSLTHVAQKMAARHDEAPQARDALEQRHRDFHHALISACGSRWLVEFSSQLYLQTERYRRPNLPGVASWGASRDVAQEHREIMEAAFARDAARALALLETHYRQTALVIEQRMAAAA